MLVIFDDCKLNYSKNIYFKYVISRIYSNNLNNIYRYVERFNYILNLTDGKGSFIYLKNCYLKNLSCIIFLDATASLLQILSLLVNDKKLYNLCNINSLTINDPYSYIIKKVLEKVDAKDFIFKNIVEDRKFIKHTIITFLYNSKPHNISKNFIGENFNYRGVLVKDLTLIVHLVIDTFIEEFPNIKNLMDLISFYARYSIIKHSKVRIRNYSGERIEYSKKKGIKKRIRIPIFNKSNRKMNISIYKKLMGKEINIPGTVSSVRANLFHLIDSNLILNVVHKLNKLNIKVLSIHDCIGVSPSNILTAIKVYNEEL
jgi:hypothetical protein